MSNAEILALYDEMTSISGRMLGAANAGDWELLVELEHECAAHVERLRENERALLETVERNRKVVAIRTILANDRKIRDLTQPWMAKLSALMNNNVTERRLARAYGI